MAKDFKFNFTYKCEDICTCKTGRGQDTHPTIPTMIGSAFCKEECSHYISNNDKTNTITCPKILYRHPLTGKVIMRKK